MSPLYERHAAFICATCFSHTCNMPHSYAVFLCVTFIPMCDIPHSYVWYASVIRLTYLTHMCDMPYSYVWHASFICVTCHIHMCNMPHSHVWHASFIQFPEIVRNHGTGILQAKHVPIVQQDALLAMRFWVNTLSNALAADHRPAHWKNRELDKTRTEWNKQTNINLERNHDGPWLRSLTAFWKTWVQDAQCLDLKDWSFKDVFLVFMKDKHIPFRAYNWKQWWYCRRLDQPSKGQILKDFLTLLYFVNL